MAMTKENWTAPPDGACVNCRARKVRCGRERPRCGNCRRDGAECAYSSPPKRVNHIKVLCQNFEDIQTRLIMVQEDLSVLTTMFKQANVATRPTADTSNGGSHNRDLHSKGSDSDCGDEPEGHGKGHIFRDDDTLIEQYHGMWTLVSQCHDFAADVKATMVTNADKAIDEVIEGKIKMLTQDTVVDDSVDVGKMAADETVRLPSKQFLSAILDTFFKLVDHNTDISDPEITYEALERVYKEPLRPSSEIWAVYFNLIILVVLGAESPNLIDDPFIRPALQASQVAIKKSSIFLGPKLINVQTLALLSLLAHRCQNEELGDSLFMQACMLAKSMGLDQTIHGLQASGLSHTEAAERRKVYESLFVRDQCAAITRGIISWLPSSNRNVSSANLRDVNSRTGSNGRTHYSLARIQSELLSTLTPGAFSSQDQLIELSRLRDRLLAWSQEMSVPSSTPPSTMEGVSIHLAFLSTRIRLDQAMYGCDAKVSNQLLQDSRLCCLLLVASCCRPVTDDLLRRLHCLLGEQASTAMPAKRHDPLFASPSSSQSSSPPSSTPASPPLAAADAAHTIPYHHPGPALSVHKLWTCFPPAAVFILSRNIMQLHLVSSSPASPKPPKYRQKDNQQSAETREDLLLLDTLRKITQPVEAAANFRLSSCTSKLGTVIRHVVDLLTAVTQRQANLADSLTPMSFMLQEPPQIYDAESLAAYNLPLMETSGLPWPVSGAPDMVSTSEPGYFSAISKSFWDKQVELSQLSNQVTMEGFSWPTKFGHDVLEEHRDSKSGGVGDESSGRGKKRQRGPASRGSSNDCSPGSRHGE